LFLDPTCLAQFSDGGRTAFLAGSLCPESRCLIALMSGTETTGVPEHEPPAPQADGCHVRRSHGSGEDLGVLQRKILLCLTVSCRHHHCKNCPACRMKNPITQPAKGSRKPIRSRCYRDRFQIDLIDFRKLRRKRIPLVFLCAGS
jgi:hypothetical protein